MNTGGLRVAIIGGGLGGLCLAQSLKTAGVSVAVYERDSAADARPQGTRLHINPTGSAALRSCLPEDVFELFKFTSGRYGATFTVLNKDLHVLAETHDDPEPSLHSHWSADRMILRRVLLTGLEHVTHFSKKLTHYKLTSDGTAVACFEDGSSVETDVLVGADGVGSRVRQQYLPHAAPFDTGALIIGARIPFSDKVHAVLPRQATKGGAMVVPGDAPCALVLASWRPEQGELRAIAGMSAIPKLLEIDQNGYAVFGFFAEQSYLGPPGEEPWPDRVSVRQAVELRMESWHKNLRALVEMIDPSELGVVPIRSSTPVEAWSASRITLLGDAIHSMTPFQGNGANIALKDAQTLSAELTAAVRDRLPIVGAIERYEKSMRAYGFKAVSESLALMNRLLGRKASMPNSAKNLG
jgi:2-polyprenyl-6-methoxyphenol hydroxylase-like FAD-dependent oxidoreductase